MSKVELEPAGEGFEPVPDRRPRVDPPPPVRLVAVEDCQLMSAAGLERELDAFYVGLLRMERDEPAEPIVYRTETFRLRFKVVERRPPREDYRPLGVAVPSLAELAERLIADEIEFTRQRGQVPGVESLLLFDPAGNLVEVTEFAIAI